MCFVPITPTLFLKPNLIENRRRIGIDRFRLGLKGGGRLRSIRDGDNGPQTASQIIVGGDWFEPAVGSPRESFQFQRRDQSPLAAL